MCPLGRRYSVVAIGELDAIQEALVTKGNIGIVPVSRIDDRSFTVGRDTIILKHWLTTQ